MIIAESLLDKRDCTVAEVVTERPSQAPCLAPLVSSICLLRPRGEGLRPDFSYCGHSFSSLLFFLPVFLSLFSTPLSSLLPLSRPHFLVASSFCLALGRSSSRFVTLFFIVERAQRLLRVDMITYGNSGGNITFSFGCPRAPVPLLIERD